MKTLSLCTWALVAFSTGWTIYRVWQLEREHRKWKRAHLDKEKTFNYWAGQLELSWSRIKDAHLSGDDEAYHRAVAVHRTNLRRYEREVLGWK